MLLWYACLGEITLIELVEMEYFGTQDYSQRRYSSAYSSEESLTIYLFD